MTAPFRVAVLDEDHVITLVRLGLEPPDAAGQDWIRHFFAPEIFDPAELYALSAGLHAADGVSVQRARGDNQAAAGANAILFRRGTIDAALLAACPELRLVQRLGANPAPIDLPALHSRRIPASCLGRRTLAYTAEHALLLMLALAKRLPDSEAALRAGAYDKSVPYPDKVAYNWVGLGGVTGLHGRTLGIVGLGEVGALLARMAAGFGMTVLYHNRNQLPPEREAALGVAYRGMDALLETSDIVSIHAPNTPATKGLIGAAALARMRPAALLINTARGALVDEDALYDALAAGRLAGAGLDVHATEPRPAADRFCRLPNVILTPHLAGGSRRGLLAEVVAIYDNLRAARNGGVPPHDRVA